MAESTVLRTKRDGEIVIMDSAGAHSYTISYEPGDFSYDVPGNGIVSALDRGSIGSTPSIRYGDEQPMTFSFTATLRDLGDASKAYATLLDICHIYDGGYVDNTWVSTLGINSDVVTWTVAFTVDGSAFGESDKTITFPYCVLTASVSEGDPDTVSVKGTSYAARPVLS